MWAKLSGALRRPLTASTGVEHEDEESQVMAGVFQHHPNLSNFHEPSEVPVPSPSPPLSPSNQGRRIFLKPPLKIQLQKKVKSSLQTNSNPSEVSLSRPSVDSETKPSPMTPTTDAKFGSLRSILRDRNTPATGQSVRFFSRDAYKVLSPDTTDSSHEDMCFAAGIQRSTPRPHAQDLFSSAFDLSPPSIAAAPPLLDSAVEVEEDDAQDTALQESRKTPALESAAEIREPEAPSDSKEKSPSVFGLRMFHAPTGSSQSRAETPQLDRSLETASTDDREEDEQAGPPALDRSHSFSFGQTMFNSLREASRSRSRALSDTVFHSARTETGIHDESPAVVVYASPEQAKEKDPFGANATTYYTPGAGVPPTPPQPTHARTASKEDDTIWSLRTQLALQSELCVQFELDLGARDETVRVLGARLEACEMECERRKNAVRSWRQRVSELERCVRGLQDAVDRSREESVERSVMDQASGEALRMLHRRIGDLEREKTFSEDELKRSKEELLRRDRSEQELKASIKATKEGMERMDGQVEDLPRQDATQRLVAWEEERAQLMRMNDGLRNEQISLQNQLTDVREEVLHREREIGVMKAELEAQWKHTETAGEKEQELARERDKLRAEVNALHERISEMEVDWNETENRKTDLENEAQELWNAKEDAERERNEFEDQLRAERDHSDQLIRNLRQREDRVTTLEREKQYALDTVSRLENHIRERDDDVAQLNQRVTAYKTEAEAAQEEMAKMKRDHGRMVNEQSRKLQEVIAREVEARAGFEEVVRAKAEADVQLGNLKERASAQAEETDRLRRQVHTLQQESADKEVRLANYSKQRAQDKQDLQGLNIALDSKQQELELLKRRTSVRGTAGGGQVPKAPHHRRESSIFGTPALAGSRPPSVLSDTGSSVKDCKLVETPSTITKATVGKSSRLSGTSTLAARRSTEGSVAPPLAHAAGTTSTSATPTRIPSGSRAGPPSSLRTAVAQRRASVSFAEPSRLRHSFSSRERLTSASASSETDDKEKENTAPTPRVAKRMSAMPA